MIHSYVAVPSLTLSPCGRVILGFFSPATATAVNAPIAGRDLSPRHGPPQ